MWVQYVVMMQLVTHKMSTYIGLGLLLVSGPIFLMSTNPQNLPLPLLIVPFLWLFMSIFWVTLYIVRKFTKRLSKSRRVIVAGVFATFPVLLLVFQSIHQLTIRDVVISVAMVCIAAFYLDRADFIH